MRVAKTDTIAGLPAPTARSLVRLFRGGMFTQETADGLLSRNSIEDTDAAFSRLEEAGYLARVDLGDDGFCGGRRQRSETHWPWRASGNQ
jgi:hypothetical protein